MLSIYSQYLMCVFYGGRLTIYNSRFYSVKVCVLCNVCVSPTDQHLI